MQTTNVTKISFLNQETQKYSIVEFEVEEKISEPFVMRVRALPPAQFDVSDLKKLNGKVVIVKIDFYVESKSDPQQSNVRYYSGIVIDTNFIFQTIPSAFSHQDSFTHGVDFLIYPFLWKLNFYNNYSCFTGKNSKDILTLIFNHYKKSDENFRYEFKIFHPTHLLKRENCIQYGESDFDFMLRLLQEDGLSYFFKHSAEGHTLFITDDVASCFDAQDSSSSKEVVIDVLNEAASQNPSAIFAYSQKEKLVGNAIRVFDADFRRSGNLLQGKSGKDALGAWNIEDQGLSKSVDVLNISSEVISSRAIAAVSREQMEQKILRGSSRSRLLALGKIIKTKFKPISDKLKISSVTFRISSMRTYYKVSSMDNFIINFEAYEKEMPFVKNYQFKRNVQTNITTAVVFGKEKAHPDIDAFMRLKIRFPWQLEKDDTGLGRSPYILARLAQPFAGNTFGFQFIPQVGHEVLVAFEHGDPELPIIVGSLYNNLNVTPAKLPDEVETFYIKATEEAQIDGKPYANSIKMINKKGSEALQLTSLLKMEMNASDKLSLTSKQLTITVGKEGITIQTEGEVSLSAKKNITIKTEGDVALSGKGMDLTASGDMNVKASGSLNVKASGSLALQSDSQVEIKGSAITLSGSSGNLKVG